MTERNMTQADFYEKVKESLLGSTSLGRMKVNMIKIDEVMKDWPNSEKMDVLGAMYAFLFSDFYDGIKKDMINEGESSPRVVAQMEKCFYQYVAARITMDVTARVFKDKVLVFKIHKLANDLKDLDNVPNPLLDLYEDHTTHGNK